VEVGRGPGVATGGEVVSQGGSPRLGNEKYTSTAFGKENDLLFHEDVERAAR